MNERGTELPGVLVAASHDAGGVVASRGLGPEMSDAEGRVEFVVRFYRDFAAGTVKIRVDQPPFTVFQKKWEYADIWGREVAEDVVLERGEAVTIRIENVPRDLLELRTIWVHAVVGEGDDIVHAALLHPDPETGEVDLPMTPGKPLELVITDTSNHYDQSKLRFEAPVQPEILIRLEPDQDYTPLRFRIPSQFAEVRLIGYQAGTLADMSLSGSISDPSRRGSRDRTGRASVGQSPAKDRTTSTCPGLISPGDPIAPMQ